MEIDDKITADIQIYGRMDVVTFGVPTPNCGNSELSKLLEYVATSPPPNDLPHMSDSIQGRQPAYRDCSIFRIPLQVVLFFSLSDHKE